MIMHRLWQALLISAVLMALGSPAWGDVRIAIAVGNNVGRAGEEPLRYAEQDAQRMHDLLIDLGRVDRGRAYLLKGQNRARLQATLAEVRGRAEELSRQNQEVSVVFYFAGHGSADALHLGGTSVTRAELVAWLNALPVALRVVVIDTCRATVGRSRGVRRGGSFNVYVDDEAAARGTFVITSSSDGEPAQESDLLGGAVFTHYWLSGLRGAADRDQDGRVTISEAYSHAYRRTLLRSASGAPAVQHPAFSIDVEGSGDMVLTEPAQSRAALMLPAGQDQRYLVYRLPAGAVLAEVGSSPTRPVRLAVPPGRLLVQRRSGASYGVVEVEVQTGRTRHVSPDEFQSVPFEEVALRGGRFDLHPTTIGLGPSGGVEALPGGALWLFGPELSVSHRFGRFVLAGVMAPLMGTFETVQYHVEELDIRTELLIGTWFQAGPLTFHLRGGLRVAFIRQRLEHRADRALEIIGSPHDSIQWSTAPGGVLQLGMAFPVGRGFGFGLWFSGSLAARFVSSGDEEQWRPIGGGAATLSLTWSP